MIAFYHRIVTALLLAVSLHAFSTTAGVSAHWVTPDVARIEWQGSGHLYVNGVLYATYPRDASYSIDIGNAGSLDGAYRPYPGSVVSIVRSDGTQERAVLGAKPLYFPLWR